MNQSDIEPRPFRHVLRSIDGYSHGSWLYLPESERWELDSPCLILESDEVPPDLEDEADAGVPEIAKRLRMVQALAIADVQDIVRGARMQKPEADDETLLKAFLHYYDNDSYIDLA